MPSSASSGSISAISAGSTKDVSSPSAASRATLSRAGVDERLRHGQQVARLDVAGVADADLVGPVHDRVRAAHREQRGHGVGVVAAHHAERATRVAAAERVALEQDHAPGAAAAELVGDGGAEEPAADHDDICALAHGARVCRDPLRRCYGPPPPSGCQEAMVPSPRDDSLFVPSRTAEHARTFVSWPCRAELWDDAPRRGRGRVRGGGRGDRALRARDGDPPARDAAAPAGGDAHPVDVAEVPIDDSWVRDNGPIFVVDGRGGVAAVQLRLQRLGRQVRALRRRCAAAGAARAAARDARLRRAARGRGRRTRVRRRGDADHDGVRPAQPQPQSRRSRASSVEELLRRVPRDREGDLARAAASSRIATPTATPTTSCSSCGRASCSTADGARPLQSELGRSCATTAPASRARPTRPAASSRSSRCRCCPYVEVDGERFVVPYVNYFPVNGGIVAPQLGQPDDEVGLRAAARAVPRPRGRGRSQPAARLRRRRHRLHHPADCRPGRRSRREEVAMIRTGEEYRASLRDGREVWMSGERVARRHDASAVPAARRRAGPHLRHGARGGDARRRLVCRRDGERNAISTQLPRTREDWAAKQRMVDAVFDDLGGVVTRVGDETVGEMWSLFDGKAVLDEVDPQWSGNIERHILRAAARRPVPRLRQHGSQGRSLQAAAGSGPGHAAARRARDRQRHRRARRQVRDRGGLLQPGLREADDRELGRLASSRSTPSASSSTWGRRGSSTSAARASPAVRPRPTTRSPTASTRSTRCSSSTTSRSRGRTSSSTATRARRRYIRATLHRYSAFAYVQRNVRLADLMIGAALHNVRQTGLEQQQARAGEAGAAACYREGIHAHLTAAIALAEESPGGLLMPNQSLLYTGRVLASSQMPTRCTSRASCAAARSA